MRVAASTFAFCFLLIAFAAFADARLNDFEGSEEHYDVLIDPFDGEDPEDATTPQSERRLFFRAIWNFFFGGKSNDSGTSQSSSDVATADEASGDTRGEEWPGKNTSRPQHMRSHQDFGIVGSYVSLVGNCTQPTDVCEFDGHGNKGIYICRQVPEILQTNHRTEVTKCIDPEFAHSTDRCGCCGGKCTPPCPCPCKPNEDEVHVDGSKYKLGFEMILENDDNWKICVPESDVDTMRALGSAKCDMSCPQAEKLKEKEGAESNRPKGENPSNSTSDSDDSGSGSGSGSSDGKESSSIPFFGGSSKDSDSNEEEGS